MFMAITKLAYKTKKQRLSNEVKERNEDTVQLRTGGGGVKGKQSGSRKKKQSCC